jgi:hypothetical protein
MNIKMFMLAWKKAKNPQAVAAFLQWKNKHSHAGVPLSICMSSYATLNPPTPVPPLNLKGPSDLCPGPKKTLQSTPGLLLIWSVAMSWHYFIETAMEKSLSRKPIFHKYVHYYKFCCCEAPMDGVLFGLNYIITIFQCLQKLSLK